MKERRVAHSVLGEHAKEIRALKERVRYLENQKTPTVPRYKGGPLDGLGGFPDDPVDGQQAHGLDDSTPWHYRDGEWRTGLHLLQQDILTVAGDTITIDNIPAHFGSLLLKLETLTTEAIGDEFDFYGLFGLTFNDDDGHNYVYREANKDIYSEFAGDQSILFPVTLDTDAASLSAFEIKVSSYQEDANTTVQGRGVLTGVSTGANRVPVDMCGSWVDTAVVTKITLSSLGNFVAGTQWRLFGHGQARDDS